MIGIVGALLSGLAGSRAAKAPGMVAGVYPLDPRPRLTPTEALAAP